MHRRILRLVLAQRETSMLRFPLHPTALPLTYVIPEGLVFGLFL